MENIKYNVFISIFLFFLKKASGIKKKKIIANRLRKLLIIIKNIIKKILL